MTADRVAGAGAASTVDGRTAAPPQRIRLMLVGLLMGMLLAMLDNFIVGTAMPTILRELGGASLMSWVITAYTLTSAVSTPVWGKLGDLYGRKFMFQLAVLGFVTGSVFAALAPSMGVLIAARAFQGLGAGGLAVGAFAVIGDLVPPRERGTYQGMVALVIAAGTIGGPLVGGFITDGFGWRWAFLINVPLGVITLLWVGFLLKLPAVRRRARIDWVGALLLGGAISAVVLLTTWAGSPSPWALVRDVGLGLAALAFIGLLVRQERRDPEPLLPLHLFANRTFTMAAAIACVTSAVSFACAVYLPLFQQTVQGVSAKSSGLLLLPMMVPLVIVSWIAGRAMAATGRYKVFPVVGALSLAAGSFLLATMTTSTPSSTTATILVLVGVGLGFTQMTTTIAQNSVDQSDIGAASSAVTLLRAMGGSIAIAVFGSVYASHTGGLVAAALSDGIVRSTSTIFLLVGGASVLAAVAALSIKETLLRGAAATEPAATPVAASGSPIREAAGEHARALVLAGVRRMGGPAGSSGVLLRPEGSAGACRQLGHRPPERWSDRRRVRAGCNERRPDTEQRLRRPGDGGDAAHADR